MEDLPPKLGVLRTSHTFAALSHFLFTFKGAIRLPQASLSDVEDDLAGAGTVVLPTLVARLLVIMTHDRKITNENFEGYLRRQFTRRVPYKNNPLGTEDEPTHWPELEMSDKLDMLFHLCEWQFAGAGRLRTMMGEVDELEWRLEPIGQDSKKNTYWFIGGDRLWVQRPNPNPPPPKPKKRRGASSSNTTNARNGSSNNKRGGAKPGRGRGRGRPPNGSSSNAQSSRSRPRGAVPRSPSPSGSALMTNSRTRSGGRPSRPSASNSSGRPMRSAALQANVNLKKRPFPSEYFEDDVEEPVPAVLSSLRSSKRARTGSGTPLSSLGPGGGGGGGGTPRRSTRNSKRGEDEDGEEEWQQVPDEWLEEKGKDASGDEEDASGEGEDDDESSSNKAKARPANGRRIVSPSSSPPPADPDSPAPAKPTSSSSENAKAEDTEGPAPAPSSTDELTATAPSASEAAQLPPPSSSPSKPKSESVPAIFDSDDSDLTDLSDSDEGSDNSAASKPKPRTRRTNAKKPVSEPVEDDEDEDEEMADGDLEEDEDDGDEVEDEDEGEDGPVDEEYEIRIGYGRPKDWIEWETVCVTLEEWEEFPLQFEKTLSAKERALYKTLIFISESVTDAMKAVILEAQREAAQSTRKRSSRLQALEDQQKAEDEAKKKKAAEVEGKGREKRQEKREQTRAERAAEREQRMRQKEIEAALEAQREEEEALAASRAPPPDAERQPSSAAEPETTASGRPSRAAKAGGGEKKKKTAAPKPVRERETDWDLDCEVCGMTAKNIKETPEVVCCDICGKWQHTACHDGVDIKKGKKPRDWSTEHFMCNDCDRDDRRRKKSRGIKAAKAAAAAAANANGPRLTQDGRPAATPGPQPAQRLTAKGGHRTPVPLPSLAGGSGAGAGYPPNPGYAHQGWNGQQQVAYPGGGVPMGYNTPQRPTPTMQQGMYASPQHPYPSPTVHPQQRPGEFAPLPPMTPAGSYPQSQAYNQQLQRTPSYGYPQQQQFATPTRPPPQPYPNPTASYGGMTPGGQPSYSNAPPPHPAQVLNIGTSPTNYYPPPPQHAPPPVPYGVNGSVTLSSPYQHQGMNGQSPLPHSPVVDYRAQQQPPPQPQPQQWSPSQGQHQFPVTQPYMNGGGQAMYNMPQDPYRGGPGAGNVPSGSNMAYTPYPQPGPGVSPGSFGAPQQQQQFQGLPVPVQRSLSIGSSPHLDIHSHHSSQSPRPSQLPSTPLSASGTMPTPPPHNMISPVNGPPPGQIYIPPATSGVMTPAGSRPSSSLGGGDPIAAHADEWDVDPKTGRMIHRPKTFFNNYTNPPPAPVNPPASDRPPRVRKAPAVAPAVVEPHGPNQHFSGSFRAVGVGMNASGPGSSASGALPQDRAKQQVYQPPVAKSRASQAGGGRSSSSDAAALDNLAALADVAQAQAQQQMGGPSNHAGSS